ncbi:hypothetical protein NPIL_306401 [Nephila pilipes]|uniref:Uncharacterized protein n=1 Tax=Nephila pilipes TaxID=299642 RepID=A0A8X6R514_NEPPI|nr:hypothetical protein NPIL_306401 [Nephila pilipes]
MDNKTIEKTILLVWLLFTIRFIFVSHWEILFLWPTLLVLDGLLQDNTTNQKNPGDKSPRANGINTQENLKIQEQWKHSMDLDNLITKLMDEEIKKARKKIAKKREKLGQ